MTTTELGSLTQKVNELARNTGKLILEKRASYAFDQIESKGLHNYVTDLDKLSEKILVEELEQLLPESGFIAEEGTSTKKGETYNWIIDPIDGTTNFIHGIPAFAISIALKKKKKIVMGVVYEMTADELFYSYTGAPAYLNGKEISVTNQKECHLSLLATGFPYHDYDDIKNYLGLLGHFMKTTSGIRRLGSAAVDLVYVACGRFEGFYEYGLNSWDVAGGAFIVQQAGGKVTDWKGSGDFVFGEQILASNGHLHTKYLNGIQKYFA